MQRGPVDVVFLEFPSDVSVTAVADVLRGPVEEGVIRLIDCVLLLRDDEGNVLARDLEDEEGLPAELRDLDIDAHDLLSDEDLVAFADSLPPGRIGLAVVLEVLWVRSVVDALEAAGAELGMYARLDTAAAEALFAAEPAS